MASPANIEFFSETSFDLDQKDGMRSWLHSVCDNEGKVLGFLNYVFLDDEALLAMNKEYLDHDYYTDVITFNYNTDTEVSGEVFISVDRVRDNASTLKKSFDDELCRVIVHGLLHLVGYDDKQADDKLVMSDREDYYLTSRPF